MAFESEIIPFCNTGGKMLQVATREPASLGPFIGRIIPMENNVRMYSSAAS